MGSKFNRITEILLIGLVSLPIVLFVALIVAAILLFNGVTIAVILTIVVLIVLLIPLAILGYFIKLWFTVYDEILIKVTDENGEVHEFNLMMKVKMKNLIRLFRINYKEKRSQGIGFISANQQALVSFYENDLKSYLSERIKQSYGLDEHDLFERTPMYKIEINFR